MSFAELLASFIGRTVEVYFSSNPPIIGELVSVDDCLFTVQINNTYYYSPPVIVTIVPDQVDYIRVVA
jgi:small nuclear ribonucleoprotein (snRNP)-like protein